MEDREWRPIDLHPVVSLLSNPRITPEMLRELSNLGIDGELGFVPSLSSLARSLVQLKPPKPNNILTPARDCARRARRARGFHNIYRLT